MGEYTARWSSLIPHYRHDMFGVRALGRIEHKAVGDIGMSSEVVPNICQFNSLSMIFDLRILASNEE